LDIVERSAGAVLLVLAYTAVAVPVMRHYAREIPLLTHAGIALGSFVTMALVMVVIYRVAMSDGSPAASAPSVLIFAAFFLPGIMITQFLKRRGVSKPFPGIGARVMIVIFAVQTILSAIFVIAMLPRLSHA